MKSPYLTRHFRVAAVIATASLLTACEAQVTQRGIMPDIDKVAALEPAKSTRADVERALGSPSSINMFGQETWIYIGETSERLAFFEPKVKERSVLIVTFDEKGVVGDVRSHGLDAARSIDPVERTTPTVGKDLTAIEQLVGNLNRLGKLGQK